MKSENKDSTKASTLQVVKIEEKMLSYAFIIFRLSAESKSHCISTGWKRAIHLGLFYDIYLTRYRVPTFCHTTGSSRPIHEWESLHTATKGKVENTPGISTELLVDVVTVACGGKTLVRVLSPRVQKLISDLVAPHCLPISSPPSLFLQQF